MDWNILSTFVDKLKSASISEFKAKDIFRASGLSLLGISNSYVKKDQQKLQSGDDLSPLLLIRDSVNGKVGANKQKALKFHGILMNILCTKVCGLFSISQI